MKMMKKIWAGLVCSLMAISSLQAGWTPVITLDNTQAGSNFQYTPSNSLLVSWTEDPFDAANVKAAFLSPLGLLSTPTLLGNGVGSISSVNPTTGDAVVIWQGNGSPTTLEASTYDAGSGIWTPATLDTSDDLNRAPFAVSYDPVNNVAVAVWVIDDGDTPTFKAAKFSAGTWSSAVAFQPDVADLRGYAINSPKNGPFAGVAYIYLDVDTFFYLQVSTYSAQTNSWIDETPKQLPIVTEDIFAKEFQIAVSNSGQIAALIPIFDSSFDVKLAVWGTGQVATQLISNVDSSDFVLAVDDAGRAYAVWSTDVGAVINGSNFLFATPANWSPVATLATSLRTCSIAPDANGNLSVGINAFVGINATVAQEATYIAGSIASQGSWSPLLTVSDMTFTNEITVRGGIASNPAGVVLLSWQHSDDDVNFALQEVHKSAGGDFTPFFTILDGISGSFGARSFVSNAGNKAIVTGASFLQLVASNNLGEFLPFTLLTVFIDDVPVVGPNPPTNFIGQGGKNKFLTQTERFNGLRWTASTTPTVVNYILFRNGQLIAVIPANGPLLYVDHNRNKHVTDTYTLYAVDANGNQSTPVTVVVH